jgi:hypothetical protein
MLGQCIVDELFCYVTNIQAKQQKSENEEKERLVGLPSVFR